MENIIIPEAVVLTEDHLKHFCAEIELTHKKAIIMLVLGQKHKKEMNFSRNKLIHSPDMWVKVRYHKGNDTIAIIDPHSIPTTSNMEDENQVEKDSKEQLDELNQAK